MTQHIPRPQLRYQHVKAFLNCPIIFRSQQCHPTRPVSPACTAVYGFMSGVVLEDLTCSLDWWLSRDGQDNPRLCTIREAGVVAVQILQALETLHSTGVIHL